MVFFNIFSNFHQLNLLSFTKQSLNHFIISFLSSSFASLMSFSYGQVAFTEHMVPLTSVHMQFLHSSLLVIIIFSYWYIRTFGTSFRPCPLSFSLNDNLGIYSCYQAPLIHIILEIALNVLGSLLPEPADHPVFLDSLDYAHRNTTLLCLSRAAMTSLTFFIVSVIL